MDVPDPSAATAIADTLQNQQTDVRAALGALGPVGRLLPSWQGAAAAEAQAVLADVLRRTEDAADALEQAAETWFGLAGDLRHATYILRAVDTASTVATVLGVVSAVQAGLDPITDAATGAEGGVAVAALAAARAALRTAVERLVSRSVTNRALLVAARAYLAQVAISGVRDVVGHAALDVAVLHRIRPADLVGGWLIDALVPRRVSNFLIPLPDLGPAPPPVPSAFANRADYDEAVAAADHWASQDAGGARVTVTAGPDDTGVVVRVRGGGVAAAVRAATGLPADHPYRATELGCDPSLSQLLTTIDDLAGVRTILVDAPATALLE